jgi:cytidylate kinase
MHDVIEDLFSLHPPTETLVRRTAETILRLAALGHAILVGRGASVITESLPGMLHIRLGASLEHRVANVMEFEQLDRKAALRRIKQEEGGRRRYLIRYYGKDITDPLLYHFVINTDRVSLPEAVKMVCAHALSNQIAGTAQW